MSSSPGFLSRLRAKLNRGDSFLPRDVRELLSGGRPLDDTAIEEIETLLLLADCGVDATARVVDGLRRRARGRPLDGFDAVKAALGEELVALLEPVEKPLEIGPQRPFVILVVGVNGVGKTTTIGKLAARETTAGRRVVLAAADTFRAAASDQLRIWADRTRSEIVSHAPGADPAAVVYDALDAAVARGADLVIVDTAGRLHTKSNLMDELAKIRRVIDRRLPGATPETLLVLDATTGQNGLSQASAFMEAVDVSGVVLTKLDGTAKGGIVIAIQRQLGLPVKLVGLGEELDDLADFDPDAFVEALFAEVAQEVDVDDEGSDT